MKISTRKSVRTAFNAMVKAVSAGARDEDAVDQFANQLADHGVGSFALMRGELLVLLRQRELKKSLSRKNVGMPWDDTQDLRLRSLISNAEPLENIALMMGRTDLGIQARAERLGLIDNVRHRQNDSAQSETDSARTSIGQRIDRDASALRAQLQMFVDTWGESVRRDEPIAGSDAVDFIGEFYRTSKAILSRLKNARVKRSASSGSLSDKVVRSAAVPVKRASPRGTRRHPHRQ